MAAKVKDGLFLGDAETSRDVEFLELNKISNLVNLAGKELTNVFASSGLVYFTLNWVDDPSFTLLPPGQELEVVEDLCEFIEVSLRHGISVLLFSTKGTCRCVVAAVLYLMSKYRWSFEKAYEFVQAKKPDVELNRGFVQQLFAIDKMLQNARSDSSPKSEAQARLERMRLSEWDPSYLLGEGSRRTSNKLSDFDNDELILVNSFINGRLSISALPGPYPGTQPRKSSRVSFSGEDQEEDVHMQPTAPQPRAPRPLLGAMKGSRARRALEQERVAQRAEQPRDGSLVASRSLERLAAQGSRSGLSSRESKEREMDLYDVVGLSDSGGARSSRSGRVDAWAASSSLLDRRARGPSLEEIAAETSSTRAQPLTSERTRRDPGALAALQRSGAVRGVHPEVRPDLNLSELERELFPLENLTDYESYRKSLSGSLGGSLGRGSVGRAWESAGSLESAGASTQRAGSPSVRSRGSSPVTSVESSRVPKVFR